MGPARIRLLNFVTDFSIGGTERQVMNLVRGLDSSRYDVHYGCLRRTGRFLREVEGLGVPLTEYGIHNLYNHTAFWQRLRCARHIRKNLIEIVHTYNFYSNVFAVPAARLAGASVIVASIRDAGFPLSPVQKRVHRIACSMADCIVTNADAIRRRLVQEGYPARKIVVIPNGVEAPKQVAAGSGTPLRRELGIPATAPLVAVLARLEKVKGIEYFLEAVALLAGQFAEARFLVVGDACRVRNRSGAPGTDYRKELEAVASRLAIRDRVIFTGLRDDVPRMLSEIAVSVLPSLSEGLSNTLLESMAAGVPVVATRVGGNPEAVEDGATGLLVPSRDPAALARAIALLLQDRTLASRLGRCGQQRVAECFSNERMVRRTEELYRQLLIGTGTTALAKREERHV